MQHTTQHTKPNEHQKEKRNKKTRKENAIYNYININTKQR